MKIGNIVEIKFEDKPFVFVIERNMIFAVALCSFALALLLGFAFISHSPTAAAISRYLAETFEPPTR